MSKNKDDDLLQEAFDDLYKHTIEMSLKYNWQIIAATLVAIGLKTYKTVLTDEDFESMMETVKESTTQVEPFEDSKKPTLQ
jgi:translation elongation factor EF-1beta